MSAGKQYPLSFVIKAVDKATGTVNAVFSKVNALSIGVDKVGKSFEGFGKAAGFPQLVDGFRGAGQAVGKIGSEAASLGFKFLALSTTAAFALFSITRSAIDAGDKLAELSDRAQVSVDWFASMRFAAEQADVEQEAFNGSIDKFVKNIGEMKAGGGSFLEFLSKVSPKLGEQVKGAKSTESAFAIMTDAFKRISDPAKLAALGAATFGRSGGPVMANFLHQGSAAIQKQQLEYLRLAGSQEKFARGAGDLDNALRESETAFLGLRSAAAGALFPAFTKLSHVVTDFIVKNRDGISAWAERGAAAISAWVDSGGFERLVTDIGDLISSARSFIDAIGGFKTAAIGAALVVTGPLLGAIATAVPALVSLGVALLTTPVGWFILAVGAIAFAVYEIYKHWEPIKKFFADLWGDFADSWRRAWEFVRPGLEKLQAFLSNEVFHPFGGGMTTEDSGVDPRQAFGPALGAAKAGAAIASQSTEARVTVDFSNAPPGTRVNQDPTAAPVDMSVGYAMVAF